MNIGAQTLSDIMLMYSTTIHQQHNTITEQERKIIALEQEVDRLKELMASQLQGRFGKSSESKADNTHDNEAKEGEAQVQSIVVAAHRRKKKKNKKSRFEGTEHLPVLQKIYDLPEDQQRCQTCQEGLHFVKNHITKQLEIIPLKYCIVEHIQLIYGCRGCCNIVSATKPQPPIPKAIAGASLLTDVIIKKYQDHQPLYRQAKAMKRDDLTMPTHTLGHWVIKAGTALLPLYEAMWTILKQPYLQVDETPVKLLEPNKKGYLWTYYAPHIGNHRGLVAFELSETRGGDVANERLKDFRGLLQTDGYAGYQALRRRDGITGMGCFTHARRKFKNVVTISKDTDGIAATMLKKLEPLYALERRMKDNNLSFHTKKRLRQKIARPITKDIYAWLRSLKTKVFPKSQLGQAIQYTLNQWPYLVAYLRHGMADIDTNDVENKIREIALGKKNWLFIGNKDTGKIHAAFYSLILSCVLNNLNARVYIHYVLTKVHDIRRGIIDPATILPHTIDTNILNEFAKEQIELAKKVFDSS